MPRHACTGRDRLLEHPLRKHIVDAINQRPGLTLADLRAHCGSAWGNLLYHVVLLEGAGVIVCIRERQRHFLFPRGMDAWHRTAIAALVRRSHALALMRLMIAEDRIRQSRITQRLRVSRKVLQECVKDLEAAGLLMRQGSLACREYAATAAGAQLVARFFAQPLVATATSEMATAPAA